MSLFNVPDALLNAAYRPDHSPLPAPPQSIPLASEGADFIGYALVVGRESRLHVDYGLHGRDDGCIEHGNCLVDKLGSVQRNSLQEPATQGRAKAILLDYPPLISNHRVLDSYVQTDWTVVGGQFGHGGDVDRATDTLDRGYV